MMLSNSLLSRSRPAARTLIWYDCPSRAGESPTLPAATLTFCSRSALTTSPAVMPRAASRGGSSQSRIEYLRSPKMITSLTPGIRFSASRT